MAVVSSGAVAYSVAQIKKEGLETEHIPVMGVMGAFVFAAQMINFTIPVTGSSGHIGGGIILSAVLGGPAALISITAVLIIQALFFADGGLLALGCNIFNMGVIPCLITYPLLFRPMFRKK
jgi:cobalt/nickel transport system permease protein